MTDKPLITKSITVSVNGKIYTREIEHRLTLADFLRHHIDLTGTHVGCEHGICGACTVLIDGISMRSCLMLALQAVGREVMTVEGLAAEGELNTLQNAFWEVHGLQCGFCTPGILMSLTELLGNNLLPTDVEVRDVLSGHLCRCTGYQNIVAAALAAAEELNDKVPA
jgi:aerobic carbon-monoxide dehydrogenase small subunit